MKLAQLYNDSHYFRLVNNDGIISQWKQSRTTTQRNGLLLLVEEPSFSGESHESFGQPTRKITPHYYPTKQQGWFDCGKVVQ